MGKRNHVIVAVRNLSKAAGFSEPLETHFSDARSKGAIVRDMELFKVALTSGFCPAKNELDAARRCRAMVKADIEAAGLSGSSDDYVFYVALCDDHENVTVAKSAERAARSKERRERANAEQLEPYSEDELAQMFTADRHGENEKELSQALIPDSVRLRLTPSSKAKKRVKKRFNKFIAWAMATGDYGKPCVFVSVADGKGRCTVTDEKSENLDWTPVPVPGGIAEAEALAVHYAFKFACVANLEDALTGADEDVDEAELLAANSKKRIIVHVADTDVFMQAMLAARLLFCARCAAAQIIVALKPASVKVADLPRSKFEYEYYVDVFVTYAALMLSSAASKLGVANQDLLASLELLGSLGGSDKVPKLDSITSEAVLSPFLRLEKPKNRPNMDIEMFRKYVSNHHRFVALQASSPTTSLLERFKTPVKVAVDEDAVMRYFLCAFANKFSSDTSEKVCSMVAAAPEQGMSDTLVESVCTVMRKDALASYERLLKAYVPKKAKRAKEIEEWNREAVKNVDIDDKKAFAEYRKKNRMPTPIQEPKMPFQPPAEAAVLRRIVRNCVWQLCETANAAVERGTPLAEQVHEGTGKSMWGWDKEGQCVDDIVPFSLFK